MLEIATLILAIATIFLAVGAFKDRLFKPSIHIYVQSNAAFCQPICWEKPALANGYLFLVAIKNTHTWITARNVQMLCFIESMRIKWWIVFLIFYVLFL